MKRTHYGVVVFIRLSVRMFQTEIIHLISIKFDIANLYEKLTGKYYFGSYRSNIKYNLRRDK